MEMRKFSYQDWNAFAGCRKSGAGEEPEIDTEATVDGKTAACVADAYAVQLWVQTSDDGSMRMYSKPMQTHREAIFAAMALNRDLTHVGLLALGFKSCTVDA